MPLFIDLLLTLAALSLSVPIGMFCLEVALSLVPRRKRPRRDVRESSHVAVLIPAHDEAAVIARTLQLLVPTIGPGGRVVVVADNCTDDTAAIARRCGAEAIERNDPVRRGKSFALDFGLQYLSQQPSPQAVVFLDADCQVRSDTVRLLGETAVATGRPVQGLNLCDPDRRGGALQAVSELTFRFKNLVRAIGLSRLAGLCYLTGTGMALPWPLAAHVKPADGNVVEDMQLGIDLTLAGYPPLFLPEARVDRPPPQQRQAARSQRTPWEHGHLKTVATQVPRLVGLAVAHRRIDLAWQALDLGIPSLALLACLWLAAIVAAAVATLAGAGAAPLLALSLLGAMLAAAILAGWFAHCRRQIPLVCLLAAPLYAVWKLPIYAAFLLNRQRHWGRTDRDTPATSQAAESWKPN
jgi:cellulose synthase/poly-beta-1,6-N-acetylglucosamine synthase-like glycosyltransferase